jgi:glycosyltransferase involved in cell wall biosynthesis
MIRVTLIARYRDATMRCKIDWLAQQPDLALTFIYPRQWQDELLQVDQSTPAPAAFVQIPLNMIGPPSNPHRAMYRTLSFNFARYRPHIIHAEEEPDSLAALQITLAKRLFAPQAKLLLHTWQNVNRPKSALVKAVMRLTLNACHTVMCANQEAVEVLRQQGYRGPALLLPAVGVDTETFKPCPKAVVEPRPFTIGFLGRLSPEKGLDTLLAAFQSLQPPVQLVIIGNGPERARLEADIKRRHLDDRVEFRGALPPAQVARQMCDLDVLVLPSRTTPVWKEQLGRALLEAMASKVPVVGSDSGAIPEVVGEAGLIFPEGEVGALTDCLQRLQASLALRQELAERGYHRVQTHYSQACLAQRTADLYRQLIPAGADS